VNERLFAVLTRAFAGRAGRRETLFLAAWGLLGGRQAHTDATPAAQVVNSPGTCVSDLDCETEGQGGCLAASCIGGRCLSYVVDCMEGSVCCGNGQCCPAGETHACLSDADCAVLGANPCAGARCVAGTCASYILTCAPDHTCRKGACVPIGFGDT
jgi:hypothetical protein